MCIYTYSQMLGKTSSSKLYIAIICSHHNVLFVLYSTRFPPCLKSELVWAENVYKVKRDFKISTLLTLDKIIFKMSKTKSLQSIYAAGWRHIRPAQRLIEHELANTTRKQSWEKIKKALLQSANLELYIECAVSAEEEPHPTSRTLGLWINSSCW